MEIRHEVAKAAGKLFKNVHAGEDKIAAHKLGQGVKRLRVASHSFGEGRKLGNIAKAVDQATDGAISALLKPLGTPEAAEAPTQDVQYLPAHSEASPSSAVVGVGTPQDFSDVFDLDEVC